MIVAFTLLLLQSQETVAFGRSFGERQPLPRYDKGHLLFVQRPNGFEVWNPRGELSLRKTLESAPPCSGIGNLAMDSDGAVAASCSFTRLPAVHYAGGVALYASGKSIGFIDTGRYVPSHIAFDGGHNVWTFGWQRDAERNDREDREDYPIFRQYSRDGKQLAAFVQRSLFPKPGLSPGGASVGLWRLQVSGDLVGALAYSGQTSERMKWVQFQVRDGGGLELWDVGPGIHQGIGFSAALGLCRRNAQAIECFDRETKSWNLDPRFSVADPSLGLLLAAEGDALVFGGDGGNIRLRQVRRD